MASRAIYHRWLLRDLPRAYVLLVLTAFVVAILTYFIDWSTVRRETDVRPQVNNVNKDKEEQLYSGSIIVPMHKHDLCWEFTFDNRNGKMRDGGYVKCDDAERQLAEKNPPEGADKVRLRDVGKAFRHKAD